MKKDKDKEKKKKRRRKKSVYEIIVELLALILLLFYFYPIVMDKYEEFLDYVGVNNLSEFKENIETEYTEYEETISPD